MAWLVEGGLAPYMVGGGGVQSWWVSHQPKHQRLLLVSSRAHVCECRVHSSFFGGLQEYNNPSILLHLLSSCPVLRSRESVGLILPASLPQTETKPKPAGGCGRVVCLSFLPHDEREGKNLDRRRGIDASLLSQLPTFFSLTITLIGFPYNSFSLLLLPPRHTAAHFPRPSFSDRRHLYIPLTTATLGVGVKQQAVFFG